jgi:hypothetical protein
VGYQSNEDNGVSVHLNWRLSYPAPIEWLDRAKLQTLGFDVVRPNSDRQNSPLDRPAFLVFEYNGPAWEKWLKEAQRPTRPVDHPETAPRLILVDAAKTAEPLLRNYSDRGRYLIVKGVIGLGYTVGEGGGSQLTPGISQILPDSIHVPPPLSWILPRASGGQNSKRPRYSLTISYGRDFEPWVTAVGEPPKD